jgi:hypothetical protein
LFRVLEAECGRARLSHPAFLLTHLGPDHWELAVWWEARQTCCEKVADKFMCYTDTGNCLHRVLRIRGGQGPGIWGWAWSAFPGGGI